jgi:hypothetical protein
MAPLTHHIHSTIHNLYIRGSTFSSPTDADTMPLAEQKPWAEPASELPAGGNNTINKQELAIGIVAALIIVLIFIQCFVNVVRWSSWWPSYKARRMEAKIQKRIQQVSFSFILLFITLSDIFCSLRLRRNG